MEKPQIEALIEKYRPHTPKTPDKVNTMGTGKSANTNGQKGIEKDKPPHKKATKANQIKTSQNKGEKANKGKLDTLLGDPTVNTKVYTYKAKEKGQKDKVGINDIGIFEFIFHGLPKEGVDEDRLRELQNVVQEQLYQRDEERERNITKRVQEFEKTFDFVNSHLLKGVATMAELTKTDNRQPISKILHTYPKTESNTPIHTEGGLIKSHFWIEIPLKLEHQTIQIKALVCDSECPYDLILGCTSMAQLSTWQDYTSHKLYFQQILIPLTVQNNIHILPGKTGVVSLTL